MGLAQDNYEAWMAEIGSLRSANASAVQALAERDRQIEELESAQLDAVAARVQAENDAAVLRGQIEQLRLELHSAEACFDMAR